LNVDHVPQKLAYTIACKITKDPDLDESAIPGSLEDQLQFPENYLDTDINLKASQSNHKKSGTLSPMDIYAEAKQEQKQRQTPPKEKEMQRPKTFTKIIKIGEKKPVHFDRKETVYMDLLDEDIGVKYSSINLKSRPYTAAILSNRIKSSKDSSENQSKVFDSYAATQNHWKGFLNNVCKKIDRKPGESVVIRAKDYRERIEKANEHQIKSPASIVNVPQNWFLSLRNTGRPKHHVIPYGNLYTGLWIRIINDAVRQEPLIRVPGTPQWSPRKHKRRDKQIEEKKEDKDLYELIVIGKNAYEIEMKGFKNCGKEKVMRVSNHMEDERI